jgi:hypothetical protein
LYQNRTHFSQALGIKITTLGWIVKGAQPDGFFRLSFWNMMVACQFIDKYVFE